MVPAIIFNSVHQYTSLKDVDEELLPPRDGRTSTSKSEARTRFLDHGFFSLLKYTSPFFELPGERNKEANPS
jgi:hypothetical protein